MFDFQRTVTLRVLGLGLALWLTPAGIGAGDDGASGGAEPLTQTARRIPGEGNEIDLMVRTINLAGKQGHNRIRLRGIAKLFHEDWPGQVGLIGTTDPTPKMEDCLSAPASGKPDHGTACLAAELARKFEVDDVKGLQARHKYDWQSEWPGGDAGVVVGPAWKVVNQEKWQLGYNCYCPDWRKLTWIKKLIEVELEHAATGDKLRFYSAYFSAGGDKRVRALQAERVIGIVRERAQPGELPPIVVGDFNAGRFSRERPEESVKLMEQHFWRPFRERLDELLNEIEGLEDMPIAPPAYKCEQIEESQGWSEAQACWEAHQQSAETRTAAITEWHAQHDEELSDLLRQAGPNTGIDMVYMGKRSSFPKSKAVDIVPVARHDVDMQQECAVEGFADFSYQLTDHFQAAGVRLKILPAGGLRPIPVPQTAAEPESEPTARAVAPAPGSEAVAWSRWRSSCRPLKVDEFTGLAAGRRRDGAVEHFALDDLNRLWHRWQVAPNATTWSQWIPFRDNPPVAFRNLAVAGNEDGRLEIFASNRIALGFQHLWHAWQANVGWSGWENLVSTPVNDMDIAQNSDGRLEVFATDLDGALWHAWQTAPNGGWSDQQSLGKPPGVVLSHLAVARNEDGRLEAFATGDDRALWHIWQAAPHGGWAGWVSLAAPAATALADVAVGQNADGRLEAFALDGTGALWHIRQTAPNGGWSGWASFGNPANVEFIDLEVTQDKDGRSRLFAVSTFGTLWHRWQASPNGEWGSWQNMGSGPTVNIRLQAVAVAPREDGRLAVFARGSRGAVWHTHEMEPLVQRGSQSELALRELRGNPHRPGQPDHDRLWGPAALQRARGGLSPTQKSWRSPPVIKKVPLNGR